MATKSSSSEKRFRSIFEMAKEAVIVIDLHSVVSHWNPGAEAMFGYSADEMLDGSMLKIIPPQYRDRHLKAMERIIETGEFGGLVGTTFEVSAMRRDGHEFPIELSVNAWEADGKVFCSSIIRDISERKKMQEKLQNAFETIKSQKDRMEAELNVGREIQMNMVPRIFPAAPEYDEFSIYAKLEPARELGGDFYDFFFFDREHFCICIGDVSGKGVPSALFMAVAKTLIKLRAAEDPSTASILTHVNGELSRENESCMFVTVFLGMLNIMTGELTYTNAGHNHPILKRHDGSLERLVSAHNVCVAAMDGVIYEEAKVELRPGDLLLLFTDGVSEAMDSDGTLFSEERLEGLLHSARDASPKVVVESTLSAVRDFAGEADQADDITVLAVQFFGN